MPNPTLFGPADTAPQAITLSEFNTRVKTVVNAADTLKQQWVSAETVDVQVRRGHCYMELIEKDGDGNTVARVQAVAWASVFANLSTKFKQVTGQDFATGMKVMVLVSANYHELYGLKLVVLDINPEYTLGDLERRRREIVERLRREGILEMNRQLPWPDVPQRIAVVSAPGAAGYGDFINQLANNTYGLKFYTCLFAATMQGVNTIASVMGALDKIDAQRHHFDCVVIIRGGGSTSDLNSFDNYDLSAKIARFAIPVMVGIGHERDVTVLDYVAMRVKTPTAAAEWLIQRGAVALAHLVELHNAVVTSARELLAHSREQLAYYTSIIPVTARRQLDASRLRLEGTARTIPLTIGGRIAAEGTRLQHSSERMREYVAQHMLRHTMRLDALTDKVELLSPRNILNRGYALALSGGRFITHASQLKPGDALTVHLRQGLARTTVQSLKQE